jgi:hypothetical protein
MGGLRDEQLAALCGFSPKPGELSCNADATWHGMLVGPEFVEAMACCDAHLPIMRAVAEYVHPRVHPCGIPGSLFRWPENECYTDWDEAELLAASAVLACPVGTVTANA